MRRGHLLPHPFPTYSYGSGKKTPGSRDTHPRTRGRTDAQRHTDHTDEPHNLSNPRTTHNPNDDRSRDGAGFHTRFTANVYSFTQSAGEAAFWAWWIPQASEYSVLVLTEGSGAVRRDGARTPPPLSGVFVRLVE